MKSAHALSILGTIGAETPERDVLAKATKVVREMLEQKYTESPEDEGILMTRKIDQILGLNGPEVPGAVEEVEANGGMNTSTALLVLVAQALSTYPDNAVVKEAAEVGMMINRAEAYSAEANRFSDGKDLTDNIDVWLRG